MANKRISDLSSASALTLNDLMVVVNEAQTRKMTIETLLNFIENLQHFASLDPNGKIPIEQIPATLLGTMKYQSSWNASVNVPTIPVASAANAGWYYVVGTPGSTNVDGNNAWGIGDWIISNGVSWQKIDNTDAVNSWNGRIGTVTPQSGDYTTDLVTEGNNKYYTASRVLAEVLSGLSLSNTAITGADSILTALGKAQGQLNAKENTGNKSQANGYASLDATGKVPLSQIPPSILGAAIYQSSWNANTNSPAIPTASTSNKGWYYVVSVAGSTSISGINDWKLGDWIISNGTAWEKVDNTDALISWNGRTGAVVPQSGDYTTSLVTEGTNLYFTTARVLATALAGFSANNAAITASDTILAAMGKSQGQINALSNSLTGKADLISGFVPAANVRASIGTSRTSIFTGSASNTTAQTFLTLTIPANDTRLIAGSTFLIKVFGNQSQSAAANNVTFDVYLNNTTVIASATVVAGTAAQTNRGVVFDAQVTFNSTGASGTVIGAGMTTISGVLPVLNTPAVAATTVNTTNAVTLALRCTNSTSNAANIIQVTSAVISQQV